MSKHTPGNWDANHFTETDKIEIKGGKLRLLKDSEGVILAFLPQWLDDEDEAAEAKANAVLMESAPGLLEALRGLVAISGPSCTGPWDIARAAVKKAESTP